MEQHKVIPLKKNDKISETLEAGEDTTEFRNFVAPDDISESARKTFYSVKRFLNKMGTLNSADIYLVAGFARYSDMANEINNIISEEGYSPSDNNGKLSAHPLLKEARAADTLAMKYADKLGITPEARTAIMAESNKSGKDKT
ncbi:phage terminase small subunit P27 family [Weissella coleopterorum]|uniref:Phage terminase small subunit P27 family n=1 Tax=Weissella coleopterorum TaxID=2714949 RepID=A0A6G8B061_9LACO|nr:phage terminase small subunit P27 family [Weissella coleopterorum]QIL50513.1 phage terminase small subunit P27 family [Weissella coleopterorum]